MRNYLSKFFLCIALIFFLEYDVQAQTDYSTPFTFSVTNTGINRFISAQWSDMNTNWSGNYDGLTYSLQLEKPTVLLTINNIKLVMKIIINSSVYNGTVTLNPSLTIPSTTLNADNILAQYEDLHQQIISVAELIDTRLQHVIEQALVPIDWIIYKGKILNATTVRLTETSDIKLKLLPQLTFAVLENEIQLIITPTITAATPEYHFQWMRSGSTIGIRVHSNNLITIGNQNTPRVFDILSQEFNFSTTTTFPVTSTYNSSLGKYLTQIKAASLPARLLPKQLSGTVSE
ncbi:MAG: hypothetical protein K8H86_03315 [Ignavibacteriaceae bacterium]|nr:hypothetical protein [Ignavibacteriaceae bacterium]